MDNALALTGFYFTIIGFISGLFFTRLDGWYGEVRKFAGSVDSMQNIEEFKTARQTIAGIKASVPVGGFIAIGIFTTILLFLGLLVPISNPVVNPMVFIKAPLIITVIAYWLGGAWLLINANKILSKTEERIKKAFK